MNYTKAIFWLLVVVVAVIAIRVTTESLISSSKREARECAQNLSDC